MGVFLLGKVWYAVAMETLQNGAEIVVTGGAGYIGSHVVFELIQAGFKPLVIDNFSNSVPENVPVGIPVFYGDFNSSLVWEEIYQSFHPKAVIHLAASLDAAESVYKPFEYLNNNTHKTLRMLDILENLNITKLIFASTAGVYGEQTQMPILETAELNPANPYGKSKKLCEDLIEYHTQFGQLQAVVFRFFNVSGSMQEVGTKSSIEAGLLSQVAKVITEHSPMTIYGTDFPTPDGTAIRDFVHVADISSGIVLALKQMASLPKFEVFNLGSGKGYSVKEIVDAAEEASGVTIQRSFAPRREGDVPVSVASIQKAQQVLGFKLKYS